MFYFKAFGATMLALIAVNYAFKEATRSTFGRMVEDAGANAQALDQGAIPVATEKLHPAKTQAQLESEQSLEDFYSE